MERGVGRPEKAGETPWECLIRWTLEHLAPKAFCQARSGYHRRMLASMWGKPKFPRQHTEHWQHTRSAVHTLPRLAVGRARPRLSVVAHATEQRDSLEEEGGSPKRASAKGSGGSSTGSASSSRKGGGPRESVGASCEASVSAVLSRAGLDPAELQRQDPAAYSRLTVSLAQVLAEGHAARAADNKVRVPAAELMERICFLACEVGLTASDIRAGCTRFAEFLSFHVESARLLHRWLQSQHFTTEQLRLATWHGSGHGLWGTDVQRIQRSKQHLQKQFSVSNSQWAAVFISSPRVACPHPATADSVIAWLQAEPLKFSRADTAELWQTTPVLFALRATTLQRNLEGLLNRCQLSKQELQGFVRSNAILLGSDCKGLLANMDALVDLLPGVQGALKGLLLHGGKALNLGRDSLLSKVNCLLTYGFSKEQVSVTISRRPSLLSLSLENNLQPTLAALEGVLGSPAAVIAAVQLAPDLLVMGLGTISSNVAVMRGLGLAADEIQQAVRKEPQLFPRDYAGKTFQTKLRYYEVVLGRSPGHMLMQQPGYLKYGLQRVDYRVSSMEHEGHTLHKTTLTWVCCSDKQFCKQYGYSPAELQQWEAQWVQSDRVQQYGLSGPAAAPMSQALAKRTARSKAIVKARRAQMLSGSEYA